MRRPAVALAITATVLEVSCAGTSAPKDAANDLPLVSFPDSVFDEARPHDAPSLDGHRAEGALVDLPRAGDGVRSDVPSACPAGAVICLSPAQVRVCTSAGWVTKACPSGTSCEGGGCVGPIHWHLAQSVDLQYVQAYDAVELAQCTTPAADRAAGRLLCDVWHTVKTLRPRFGLFFGNSWYALSPTSSDPCARLTPATAAMACVAERLRKIVDRFHAEIPEMMLNAHLAEYVHYNNGSWSWPGEICLPGTVGRWNSAGTDTCIPDLAGSASARAYLIAWGKAFVDAGIRSLHFGQARLMAGSTGQNQVSYAGAAGLKEVIDAIRAYAASKGIATIYFGAQNASSARLTSGGVELLDYVTGAQHLEEVKGYLLQPLLQKGPFFSSIYGAGDWHDANLANDANGLPVLLDYDNSGDANNLDDIRRLAKVPTAAERARVLIDHFRHLHLYNSRAAVSIPVSKVLGGGATVCKGINQYQFSADACGLVAAAQKLFADLESTVTAPSGAADPPIRREYWGQQLRGRDVTVSWLYRALLGRAISATEYTARVGSLPALLNGAASERCALAEEIVASAEFTKRALSHGEFVEAVYRAMLLREVDAGGRAYWTGELSSGSRTRSQVVQDICMSAEAAGLYAP